jgi:8-oxo-dGTP diphosphatase
VAYTSEYPFVYLTADVVAFSIRPSAGLSVLMVRRADAPYKGRWAFPGGFVDEGEDVERAARRELREETGVHGRWLRLEQLGAYTAPRRDPRHRVVSVSWLAAVPADVAATGGDDAAAADWLPVAEVVGSRRLAFDHSRILGDALDRLRADLERTPLATRFLPPEFTVAELREVYEAVWDRSLDPGNFQRKVTGTPGLVEDTGYRTEGGRGRPATLFRAGPATEIWPPMSRERER